MACAVAVGMLATSHAAYAWVPCPTAEIPSARITEWTNQYGTSRETAKGVTLCEGDDGLNTRGFLQIVDLGDGAKIRLQAKDDISRPHGTQEPGTPYMKRTSQAWYEWIRGLRSESRNLAWLTPGKEKLFSVTNATFFKDTRNEVEETALPFPFMFDYAHDTFGMAIREAYPAFPRPEWGFETQRPNFDYDAPKSVLQLNSEMRPEVAQRVRIRGFRARYLPAEVNEWYRFHSEDPFSIRDAAVSFAGEFDNSGGERSSNRRTYVGVWGQIVYIWTSDDEYTNEEANATMLEINPGMDVIQMDGGGSTQFYSEYGHLLSWSWRTLEQRDVPTVLSVYRGP
jgi:hypothetical protein